VKRADDIRCVAGILVGGRSARMGRPKATLPLPNGRALVEHVAGVALRTGRWIDEVVILGHCETSPAGLAGLTVLPDTESGAGPLAGLCSLLEYAGERWTLLLACDMPLLEPMLVERLYATVHHECDAVAFRRPDRPNTWHACCALYHPRLLTVAIRELRQGRRSLQGLLATVRVAGLDPTPEEHRAMMNLNTPQDYDRLFHCV
jgi:molybdopterin-guanine dinucleotide biosynthesis protein A